MTVNEPEAETSEPAALIDPLQIRAAEIASSLDNRLLAAQVLICGIDGKGKLPEHIITLLKELPTGGIMLFKYNLNTDNNAIKNLLTETTSLIQDELGIPPFIAVDHEGGGVNRFLPGVATLPAASSYWKLAGKEGKEAALAKIKTDSFRSGCEISALGINLNFAPVAEYLNDNNRDFLEYRSYGPDPAFTAEAAEAFIYGMELAGVLCVIKHFPCSAGKDPHYFTSVLDGDRAALNELVSPFTSLISGGSARAVMAAHSLVPAVDSSQIASLSPAVLDLWLRGDIGFEGIIISDDFIMEAAGKLRPEEAAVRSVAAGADMILVWPEHLRRTNKAFLAALADGRLSGERLREAAQHVIYEKLRLGLLE